MKDTPHILFERADEAAWFRAVHVSFPGTVHGADEWLAVGPEERATREAALKAALPEEARSRAGDFLTALEELHVGLRHHDDADLAFSLLPATPKNRALKQLYHFYLDSPLADDRVSRREQLAERWRSGEKPPAEGRWIVVPDGRAPDAWNEAIAALGNAPGVNCALRRDPWETVDGNPGKRRSLGWPLAGGRSLETAARLATRRPSLILFQGSPEDRLALHAHLASRGKKWFSLLPESEKAGALAPSAGSRLLAALRHAPRLSPPERLRLCHVLVERGAALWDETTLDRALDQMAEGEAIREAVESALPAQDGGQSAAREAEVWLLPFPGVPAPADARVLLHVDWDAEVSAGLSSWIREGERETLAASGIEIPSQQRLREQTERAWRYWTGRGPAHRHAFGNAPTSAWSADTRRVFFPTRAAAAPTPLLFPDEAPHSRPFSATQLETYAKCPSRYWFSYRLRVRRFDPDGSGYPMILGQVVHKVLETALTKSPEVPDESAWIAGLDAAFAAALAEEAPHLPFPSRLSAELRPPVLERLRRFPAMERAYRASVGGGFAPLALEKPFEVEWNGVVLNGKIDRIDQDAEGRLIVIDYKTGTVDFSPGHVASGESFQPLVYSLAVKKLYGRAPVGVIFYDLKTGETRRGLLREEALPAEAKKTFTRGHVLPQSSCAQILDEGRKRLEETAGKIREGQFLPTPSADACGFCDFAALCRVGEGYV